MKRFDLNKELSSAIAFFWKTKIRQSKHSNDSTARGSVIGGKQMDGFLKLLKGACQAVGVPSNCMYDKNNYVP